MKKNKGITLVALIITIVVMLILVAVSVNVLIKSNLLGTAEKVGEKYKSEAREEANSGEITIDGKKYNSIDEYLAKKEETTAIHNWKRTGDQLKCNHCDTTLTIGQEVKYTKTGKQSSSIGEEESGIAEAKTRGWRDELTGVDTQTVNKDSDTKWVVLGIEDTDGDKVNETLLITTKTPTTDEIMLCAYAAYNNGIVEINRMCKELYGEDARGMTIDDVNNCLGYTPSGGMYIGADGKSKTTKNFTTQVKNIEEIWTSIKNYNKENNDGLFYDPQNPNGIKDDGKTLGECLLNGYYYLISNDGTYIEDVTNESDKSHTITNATKTLICGADGSYCYWLASGGINTDDQLVSFGLDAVEWESIGLSIMYSSDDSANLTSFPLRTVVSIKSDIPEIVE